MIPSILLKFLESKLVSIVLLTIIVGGAIWYNYKLRMLRVDLTESTVNTALMSSAYDSAVNISNGNIRSFIVYRNNQSGTMQLLSDSYKQKLEVRSKVAVIIEKVKHVKSKNDGNVSNVMRDTLRELGVLQTENVQTTVN